MPGSTTGGFQQVELQFPIQIHCRSVSGERRLPDQQQEHSGHALLLYRRSAANAVQHLQHSGNAGQPLLRQYRFVGEVNHADHQHIHQRSARVLGAQHREWTRYYALYQSASWHYGHRSAGNSTTGYGDCRLLQHWRNAVPFVGPANQIQDGDQISWSHGKHTIRAGFEYEWLQWNLSFASLLRGFLFSPGFNDFLIGRPGCPDPSCYGNYTTGTTGSPLGTWLQCLFCVRSGPNGIIHGYREHDMSAFVQDDWKVSSKLTVNIGLRWEYDGAFGDHYGNLTNVWPSLMNGVTPPTTSQPSGTSLIGYVVPSNFASHYGAPPAGVKTVSSQFPSQNSIPSQRLRPTPWLCVAAPG